MSARLTRSAILLLSFSLLTGSAFAAADDALSLVPADAVSVGVVKLSDLRNSPLASTLFRETDKFGGNGDAHEFLTEAGLEPAKDVDLLIVATAPKTTFGTEPEVLVIANGRFNIERLAGALTSRGAARKSSDHGSYFTLPNEGRRDHEGAVAFPHAGLALAGSESAVIEALAARAKGGTGFLGASGLGRDASRIDTSASAWAIIDVTRAQRFAGSKQRVPKGRGGSGEALAAALTSVSTVGLWATESGDALKLGAFGLASDGETLALLEDTIRGALAAMRLAVKDHAPDMVSVLRRFDVERSNDAVRISGTIPAESLRRIMAHKRAEKR